MRQQAEPPRNWFDGGGSAYARFRPGYPAELTGFLADIAPDRQMAVDVGCGSGQLTRQLAGLFRHTVGIDPSHDQLASTGEGNKSHDGLSYACAPAEALPLPDCCASLITAAQAAHWFDLPAFYTEARRIARQGAVIALVSYGLPRLSDPTLQEMFDRFHDHDIGRFWPPERRLVVGGYAAMDFPFTEIEPPAMEIRLDWNLQAFLGYVSTWSAVRAAAEAGQTEILTAFAARIAALWGAPDRSEAISWPIRMRLGRI